MEKKVYKIKQHNHGTEDYELLVVLPRYDAIDRRAATDVLVDLANERLFEGCEIIRIIHIWNYEFRRLDGTYFNLYMFEDSEPIKY